MACRGLHGRGLCPLHMHVVPCAHPRCAQRNAALALLLAASQHCSTETWDSKGLEAHAVGSRSVFSVSWGRLGRLETPPPRDLEQERQLNSMQARHGRPAKPVQWANVTIWPAVLPFPGRLSAQIDPLDGRGRVSPEVPRTTSVNPHGTTAVTSGGVTRQNRQKYILMLTTAGTSHTPRSVTCSTANLPQLQSPVMQELPGAVQTRDPVSSQTP